MVFRIVGGIYFVLLGAAAFGVGVDAKILAVLALIAGIALLANL